MDIKFKYIQIYYIISFVQFTICIYSFFSSKYFFFFDNLQLYALVCLAITISQILNHIIIKQTTNYPENSNDKKKFLLAIKLSTSGVTSFLGALGITTKIYYQKLTTYEYPLEGIEGLGIYVEDQPLMEFSFIAIVLILFLFDFTGYLLINQKVQLELRDKYLIKAEALHLYLIKSVQHELGNKLPALKNYFYDLNEYLSNFPENDNFSIKNKIRNPLPSEPENKIDSIETILNYMNNNINNSISILNYIKEIVVTDPNTFSPNKLNFYKFINEKILSFAKLYPSIKFTVTGSKPNLNFDKKQFTVLLDNIIGNAVRHSFIEQKTDYEMEFYILDSKENVTLNILNNGSPFPENYSIEDFKKPHNFKGKTGNSGMGGFIIGLIIENHKGIIKFIPTIPNDNYNVKIQVIIPKS